MRLPLALLALTSVGGCSLIDQNTFDYSPEAKPANAQPIVARPLDTRAPLVTIRYDVPDPTYRDLLAYAVRQAAIRRPGADFDVVTIVPARGAIADQATAARAKTRDASAVARAMTELGVTSERLHLAARSDPQATAPEVRVYVR